MYITLLFLFTCCNLCLRYADPVFNSQNDLSPPQSTNKSIPAVTIPTPAAPVAAPVTSQISQKVKSKRRLKLSASTTLVDPDLAEIAVVAVLFNLCFLVVLTSESFLQKAFYVTLANVVVLRTLNLRAARARLVSAKLESLIEEQQETAATAALIAASSFSSADNQQQQQQQESDLSNEEESLASPSVAANATGIIIPRGKPTPGSILFYF